MKMKNENAFKYRKCIVKLVNHQLQSKKETQKFIIQLYIIQLKIKKFVLRIDLYLTILKVIRITNQRKENIKIKNYYFIIYFFHGKIYFRFDF